MAFRSSRSSKAAAPATARRAFYGYDDDDDNNDDDDAATIDRSTLKFFRFWRRENFGNERMGRCDRFRPKIIQIGAILAIFGPFEDLNENTKI